MAKFQIQLRGHWNDYGDEETKILKRAFMCGFSTCKFHLRGQDYEYDFKNMKQRNVSTGKERTIRAPYKWKQPAKPVVPPGLAAVVSVPPGAAGTTITIAHPQDKSETIDVQVPSTAKTGQAMLVPVRPASHFGSGFRPAGGDHLSAPAPAEAGGASTGTTVAVTGAATVGITGAGAVVAAVVIPGGDIADVAANAGDAGDAGDFLIGF